jgi:hypothetical protein
MAVKPDIPDVAEAVQEKEVPVTLDVSVTKVVLVPAQIVCVKGAFVTAGVGLTVIV